MRMAARFMLRLAVVTGSVLAVCVPAHAAPVHATAAPKASSTQPVIGWLGAIDVDLLVRREAGGITLKSLKSSGLAGHVVMLNQPPESVPKPIVRLWKKVDAQGLLYVGVHIATPVPEDWTDFRRRLAVVATAAKRAGADGLVFDAEPYEYPDTEWDLKSPSDRATMRANAQSLAPIINGVGELLIYPSSNASFPGSYNDILRAQNGARGTYEKSLFPDFVDGLLAGGVDVTLTDASFHWGPQGSGDSWESGIAKSVALTTERFPGIKASVMLWPDNNEGHGPFPPAEVETAVEAATRLSTGPVFLYQQSLAVGSKVPEWNAWLAAIKAALQ